MLGILLGIILGAGGSVPMAGPVGVLVLGAAARGARRQALLAAVGGALGETLWCALAFLGLGNLIHSVPTLAIVARVLAAVLLLGAGLYVIARTRRAPSKAAALAHIEPKGKAFGSLADSEPKGKAFGWGLGVSALNPALLVSWGAAATTLHGLGVVGTPWVSPLLIPVGLPFGIVGWSLVAILLVTRIGPRIRPRLRIRLAQAFGAALVLLSIVAGLAP